MKSTDEVIYYMSRLGPNWDDRGALTPSPHALQKARQLLDWVQSANLRLPFISPLPDGGVEFTWDLVVANDLMITIHPRENDPMTGLVYYMGVERPFEFPDVESLVTYLKDMTLWPQ